MVEDQGVVIKHVIRQLSASVFQRKDSGLVGQDCAVFLIDEEVDRIFFRVEKKFVVRVFRAGKSRYLEGRMPTDGEIHHIVAGIFHIPLHLDFISFQGLGHGEYEVKRIAFLCLRGGSDPVGHGSLRLRKQGEIRISREAVSLGRIGHALIAVVGLIVAADVGEKDGSMPFPEFGVRLPEYVPVVFLVKNAG